MATITAVAIYGAEPYVTVTFTMTTPGITRASVFRRDADGYLTSLVWGKDIPVFAGSPVTMKDFEIPFDVPATYVVKQTAPAGSETAESTPVTLKSNGYSWLRDPAYPTMSVWIPVVTDIKTLTRASRAGIHRIINRPNPIAVTTLREGPTGTLEAATLTDAHRVSLTSLLARGTVLLLQTPGSYGFGSAYVSIGDVEEARVGLAMEQSRKWTLPFVVVDRPTEWDTRPPAERSWQGVKDTYATWGALKATGKSWRQLLEGG